MAAFILSCIIGIICIVLGVFNMRGNISSLHFYHRHRVTEEDRIPFGRRVGLGTITIGAGIILFSIFSTVTLYTDKKIFTLIGTGIMLSSIIAGLIITFRAMIKYNRGIF